MNRKFVKENKKALKEFFIDMLKSLLSKRAIGNLDKLIDAEPQMRKKKDSILQKSDELKKRLAKVKKEDPKLFNQLIKNPLLKQYAK